MSSDYVFSYKLNVFDVTHYIIILIVPNSIIWICICMFNLFLINALYIIYTIHRFTCTVRCPLSFLHLQLDGHASVLDIELCAKATTGQNGAQVYLDLGAVAIIIYSNNALR